ncbi:MAG: hypothetical protein U1F76_26520 [Candidatus Competibacteraceae bacterium]
MTKLNPVLKWSVFILLAALLAWRMIVLDLAAFYAEQRTPQAALTALAWDSEQPTALADRAYALPATASTEAETLLRQALYQNPADANLYLALADLQQRKGKMEQAAPLVTLASELAPMNAGVQLRAADFWLKQGQLQKALTGINVALSLRPSLGVDLYPSLLKLVEEPRARPLLASFYRNPPPWWLDFFRYTAVNAGSLEPLRALYREQLKQGGKPAAGQQQIYLTRLQQEGQWLELYFNWLNTLQPEQLKALGYLYNGDFELPFSQQGFDWQAPRVNGVIVETVPTYGSSGKKALHIQFQGLRVAFSHLYQYLLLEPGRYRLQGRSRVDSLQTERGVQWNLSCIGRDSRPLGSSERFLGTTEWQPFAIEFTVPVNGCRVQRLQLVLLGRALLDFEAQGSIWFDDMTITRID